jgi:hypothetical protein
MDEETKKKKTIFWCLNDLRLYQKPTSMKNLYNEMQIYFHSGDYLATPEQINFTYFSVINVYFSLSGVELGRYNSLKTWVMFWVSAGAK